MRNQRTVCRCVFVLLGVLPLMATLLFAGWRNYQYDAGFYADLLGRSLGFNATIREVHYVKPGSIRLVGVEFCEPEDGRCLLSCDRVSVNQSDDRLCKIHIPRCVVHACSGDQILYTIHERVLKQPALLRKAFDIEIVSLDLAHSPSVGLDDTVSFSDAMIELRRIPHGAELRAALLPSGANAGEQPMDVTIRRDRSQSELTTVLLKTWNQTLPTSLLVGQRNWLPCLSPQSTFRGNIECHLDPTGWSGDVLGGHLENVELVTFLGQRFGGWIDGLADLKIRTLNFRSGRIRELDFDLVSPNGRIATEQLGNAVTDWRLVWDRDPQWSAAQTEYHGLALGVYLTAGNMQLRGRGEPKNMLLRLATGERLQTKDAYSETGEPVSGILAILNGASPQNSDSAEAEFLRRVLPLPSIRQQ